MNAFFRRTPSEKGTLANFRKNVLETLALYFLFFCVLPSKYVLVFKGKLQMENQTTVIEFVLLGVNDDDKL